MLKIVTLSLLALVELDFESGGFGHGLHRLVRELLESVLSFDPLLHQLRSVHC